MLGMLNTKLQSLKRNLFISDKILNRLIVKGISKRGKTWNSGSSERVIRTVELRGFILSAIQCIYRQRYRRVA